MLNGNVDDKKEVKYDVNKSAFFSGKHGVNKKTSQSSQMGKQKKELTFRLTSFQ